MERELLRRVGEELKLLRSEGLETVSLSEETLKALKDRFAKDSSNGKTERSQSTKASKPEQNVEISIPDEKKEPKAKASGTPADSSLSPVPVIELPEGSKKEKWTWLKERVLSCKVCQDHLNPGKQLVFGTGDLDADIFFCGEAPGADEETEGLPFVGRAGQLLTGMLKAMKLTREEVYISNIMNWRPQTGSAYGNRPPSDEEIAFCLPYLRAQIEMIAPKVIVVLGGTAAKGILGIETKGKMASLRGKWHESSGIPTMVTYHPSFLLHQDSVVSKRKVWEDLLMVMERLNMPISEKQQNFFLKALNE